MIKLEIMLLFCALSMHAQTLIVDRAEQNQIEFSASATLGDFKGITHSVEGSVNWKNYQLSIDSDFKFKVYLDSIDTGINLRNDHMREDYLETSKYPTAEFQGKIINITKINFTKSLISAEGVMKIHGHEKQIKITGSFFNYGRLYKIESNFNLMLSEFNIDEPVFIINSVDNQIGISVIIYLIKK